MGALRRAVYAEHPDFPPSAAPIDALRLAVEQARVNLSCAVGPEAVEQLTNDLEAAIADLSHHVYAAKVRTLGRAEADRQRKYGLAVQRRLMRAGLRRMRRGQ